MRWFVGVALVAACGSGQTADRVDTTAEPPLNLHVVVENVPGGLGVGDFVLLDQTIDPPVRYPATGVELASSKKPVEVMVVIQGDEQWMGNETYLPPSDSLRRTGAYRAVSLAMDALGSALPPDAQTTIFIYYYDFHHIAGPMEGKLVTGAALGPQENYSGMDGAELMNAAQHATSILRESRSLDRHQALVVIGDGTAMELDAEAYIQPIANMLREQRVSVYTLHFSPTPTTGQLGEGNMKALGISGAYVATSQPSIIESAAEIGRAIAEHTGGYRVTFGLYEPPEDLGVFGVEVRGKLVNDFSFPGFE